VGGGVKTGSIRHVGHFWPIIPAPGDGEDGEFGGIKIGRGNRSTRRKPAPAQLCPLQITLDQTQVRTRAAVLGNQQLTAWAMAWPYSLYCFIVTGPKSRERSRDLGLSSRCCSLALLRWLNLRPIFFYFSSKLHENDHTCWVLTTASLLHNPLDPLSRLG
jgi:hypothetical protein